MLISVSVFVVESNKVLFNYPGEDKPVSDAEDAAEEITDDNKIQRPLTPDPPDKTIEQGTDISKLTIV